MARAGEGDPRGKCGRKGGNVRVPGMGPVFLSAMVYPGTGQCMQRRWLAAVFYLIAFSIAFGWLLVRCLAVLKAYYSLAFDFQHAQVEAPSLQGMVRPFLCSMAVYLANVMDAALAGRRHRAPLVDSSPLPSG